LEHKDEENGTTDLKVEDAKKRMAGLRSQ